MQNFAPSDAGRYPFNLYGQQHDLPGCCFNARELFRLVFTVKLCYAVCVFVS